MKKYLTFSERVYAVVSRIPKGEVRTYKWVATKAGNPLASRAVGQVLKRNRDFARVPCHRVIRSTGELGGYVKGKERKRSILEKEGYRVANF